MELLFLYVSRYKLFVDQSFNFDSRYRFSYESNGDEFFRTLTLACNERALPKDFYRLEEFGQGSIDCVSAVIGENGAGKTTLAVLIQDIMESAGDINEFVAVFGDRHDDGDIVFSVYCHVPRDVNTGRHGISFAGFSSKPNVYLWPDYTWPKNSEQDLRTKLRLIYYSPLLHISNLGQCVDFAERLVNDELERSYGLKTGDPPWILSKYADAPDFPTRWRISLLKGNMVPTLSGCEKTVKEILQMPRA